MNKAKDWIKKLNLKPHPEGGYYVEIHRSEERHRASALPERYSGDRSYLTSVYYLLEGGQISKFHRLKSDEIWYFHEGSAGWIYSISPEGNISTQLIGNNPENQEELQVIIKQGYWFATEVSEKDGFILVSCVVAPGFEFEDFELGTKDQLTDLFPRHKELIARFV